MFSVIVGAILGIKFIIGSAEEQAKIKEITQKELKFQNTAQDVENTQYTKKQNKEC